MSSRFIDASDEARKVLAEVRAGWFDPILEAATIKVLFDTKLRKRGGKIVLGRILKANDLIRRLTDDLAEDGVDYVLFLDQVAFENIPEKDKVRLVRHELRHCKVTGTVEKPKYKVIPHDIEDFVVEIELNKDNVGWASNAAQLVSDIYDQFEEERKEQEAKKEEKPADPASAPKKFLLRKPQKA
jgi:hypothetical protein